MRKFILTIWILLKHRIGILIGWIGNTKNEIDFVKRNIKEATWEKLRAEGMDYKKDFIDSQRDARSAYNERKDDCDGFNRIAQVWWHCKGYKAYLVSYWAKPFQKSHTTCILKVDGLWIDCDYGYYGVGYYYIENCIDHIARKYKAKVRAYIIQDISWRIIVNG